MVVVNAPGVGRLPRRDDPDTTSAVGRADRQPLDPVPVEDEAEGEGDGAPGEVARELALTVHPGPHDDIDVTYGALGAHLAEHALLVDGPVHETYLVGPRDTADPAAWRTEIGWPVFTTAPA